MPSDRKPSLILPVAAAALLLAYVAAYFAAVERYGQQIKNTWRFNRLPVYPRLHGDFGTPSYSRWERFFSPIHWLDRELVRIQRWEGVDLTPDEDPIRINSLGDR